MSTSTPCRAIALAHDLRDLPAPVKATLPPRPPHATHGQIRQWIDDTHQALLAISADLTQFALIIAPCHPEDAALMAVDARRYLNLAKRLLDLRAPEHAASVTR